MKAFLLHAGSIRQGTLGLACDLSGHVKWVLALISRYWVWKLGSVGGALLFSDRGTFGVGIWERGSHSSRVRTSIYLLTIIRIESKCRNSSKSRSNAQLLDPSSFLSPTVTVSSDATEAETENVEPECDLWRSRRFGPLTFCFSSASLSATEMHVESAWLCSASYSHHS